MRELQLALRAAGFDPGATDGIQGPATAEAVRRFQAANDLPVDGIAGPRTIERLSRFAAVPPVREVARDDTVATGTDVTVEGERAETRAAAASGGPVLDASPGPQAQTGATPVAPAPVAAILHSKADAGDAERIAGAIASGAEGIALPAYVLELLDDVDATELDRAGLVVVYLSRAFLASDIFASKAVVRLLERGEHGDVRLVPLLLEPLELNATPFAPFQALAGAEALQTAPDPDAWLQSVSTELADLLGRRTRSYLPRFSADSLEGEDLLERRDRVDFLASVLAAKQLETPLAIGLFGDWGSGKSFFMRRLQERIVALTEASAQAEREGAPSLYCSHVRHVTFNAWLHSGGEIWPAFAAQVFRSVSGLETEAPQGPTQEENLAEYQERLRDELDAAAADAARDERIRELEGELAEKRGALERLEPQAGPGGKLVATLREVVRRLRHLRSEGVRAGDVALLVAVGLAVAAFTVWETTFAWVAAVGAGVLSVLEYLDESRALRNEVRRLQHELTAERAAQEDRRRTVADEYRRDLPLLPEFARKEAAEWARRAEFDAVTQIRMKFERLSRLIGIGLAARAAPGETPPDAVPIERVIVYVDDLDRCQPEVVVGVLETLKLLVSLPHFVAVVGVDSRWLFRSLELHFRDLLRAGDGDGSDAVAWAATPQNYLEKIFQYSLLLQPISEKGFASLIESLLAAPPAASTAVEAPGGGPQGGPPEPRGAGLPDEEPPEGARPAVSTPEAEAGPDLTPAELVITPEEIRFIAGLGSMFETPRAAKRLANVYRLLRVSVGADRLIRDEDYEPALLLLAIGIGFPGLAGDVFAEIRRSAGTAWPAFLDGLPEDDEAWRKLKDRLRRASPGQVADRTLATFSPWIQVVCEFSFHPWQELLPAATES